jgi:hypothetical protein
MKINLCSPIKYSLTSWLIKITRELRKNTKDVKMCCFSSEFKKHNCDMMENFCAQI